ncbi:phosphate acetyltransferase [Vibrio sp. JC009]|uniref:phosphate acetyltransferase n=1 Tax=Vibrio sp. JC009 TaxID=2912314 RepID=UPI0023B18A4C|nr:phosphate acetyltransferase [Vibrio sp. JC009]WED22634.1 phosphate acetyltransferase [Vibrio sp. JC009]
MSRTIMLVPISAGVGLTSVSLGVIRAMERKGVSVSFLKPIAQPRHGGNTPDLTSTIIEANSDIKTAKPTPMQEAESLLGAEKMDVLLESIVARYNQVNDADVTLIEGLVPTRKHPFANQVNEEVAKTLGAEIVFVATPGTYNASQLRERIELAVSNYGGSKNKNICGVIINKLNAPVDEAGRTRPDLSEIFDDSDAAQQADVKTMEIINTSPVRVLGCVPWSIDLIATRAIDMAKHLNAEIISEGEMNTRRIKSITFCARSLPNMVEHFRPGSLLVTSADRPDVIVAASLAAMNGVEIGAMLLTGDYDMPEEIAKLCQRAVDTTGLPIFKVNGNTWQTSLNLQSFSLEVPADDKERIEYVNDHVAGHIDGPWIDSLTEGTEGIRRLSPPAFRYQLTELARKAGKRIILPEGDEPRTVKAAAICAERGIATCVLLGNPDEIRRVAEQQGVTLGAGVEIIDSEAVRENYVARLVELRAKKGMTEVVAREKLEDSVFLGTMMLENNEVDGLVSGAVHTTANTIVPPFQIIKTAPDASIVSSVFFMLLPDQVLVYGDCAINPDPTAEQLAEIAIQSADSATAFGVDPRVAMISYSTGESGKGADVEKVREATAIAKEKRPDLVIDGPLQYDAAIMENVAASKAPNSPVAGKATVFVFPDLNTGNTTYKAVQRSADLVSIGPMLQGMRKPVNDLSRGALVDDIVYTIALTAIQAEHA